MLTNAQVFEISRLSFINFGKQPEVLILPKANLNLLFNMDYPFGDRRYQFVSTYGILMIQEADIPKPKIIFTKSAN